MEELERYNQEYKKRLDEVGALGEIPDDLALEVMHGSCVLYVCVYSVVNDRSLKPIWCLRKHIFVA